MKKRAYIVLFVLAILIPLGLLSESPAWGEWDNEYYKEVLGFIPTGIQNANSVNSPLGDYTLDGANSVIGYYLSAFVGIIILFTLFFILMKIFKAGRKHEQSS